MEFKIEDVRVDTYRYGRTGYKGRLTHTPTGLSEVIEKQTRKSKAEALDKLRKEVEREKDNSKKGV